MKKSCKIFKFLSAFVLSFMIAFSSLCSPIGAASATSSASNQNQIAKSSTTARSGNYMYYSVNNKIYKINVVTKKKTKVYTDSYQHSTISDISVYKNYVYFVVDKYGGTGGSYPYIYRVKTDGKNAKYLTKGIKPTPYSDKIYYQKVDFNTKYDEYYSSKGIYKMSLTGSSKTCVKSSSKVENFKVYKSNIYYSYYNNGYPYIYKMTTSGKYNTKIVSYSCDLKDVYSGNVYFTKSNDYLYKYNISSKKTSCVTYLNGDFRCFDNGYLYYVRDDSTYYEDFQQTLCKLKLSTMKNYEITTAYYIGNVVVDNGYLYYERFVNNPYGKNTFLYLLKTNGTNETYLNSYYCS